MGADSVKMEPFLHGSSPTAAANPSPELPSTPSPKPENAHNAAQSPGVKQIPSSTQSRPDAPAVVTQARTRLILEGWTLRSDERHDGSAHDATKRHDFLNNAKPALFQAETWL